MINVRPAQILPSNLDQFVREIGLALRNLYGPDAEAAYARAAEASYARLIRHPEVDLWTCGPMATPGLLMSVVRREVAHVTLLHVLDAETGNGIEEALLETATSHLRDEGVRAIIGEFVQFRTLGIEQTMSKLGFTRFNRRLMLADLSDARLALDGPPRTVPCGVRDSDAAEVLVEAYRNHPSRRLHPEAHDCESATTFFEGFRAGGYGATTSAFYRMQLVDDTCIGVIAGAEAAPGVGFILHVATSPAAQGAGVGTNLIRELAEEFRRYGYDRIALGVTCGNPAEQLYERLGFNHLMPVETYAWWAPQD